MTPLPLGASTWTYLQLCDLRTAMLRMRETGLDRFDVLTIPPHLWPYDLDAVGRADLRRFFAAERLTIESLNLPSTDQNLCSITRQMRAYSVAQFGELIGLCEDLGVELIVVVPGRRANFVPPPITQAERFLTEALEQLVPQAERAGISLVLENHHMSPLPTVDSMVRFLDRFGSDRLGIAYDVANGEFVGEDQAGAIRRAGRWLRQVHLSDASRTKWDHARIGDGNVDFAAIATALTEIGYAGASMVELISDTPDLDMRSAVERLTSLGWNCHEHG